jgi:hypothetical protein
MSEMTHSPILRTAGGDSLAEALARRYDRTPINLAQNSD